MQVDSRVSLFEGVNEGIKAIAKEKKECEDNVIKKMEIKRHNGMWLALIATFCMAATWLPGPASAYGATAEATASWDGEGTAESPYLIQNAADLELLAKEVTLKNITTAGVYFKQTADLDLSAYSNWLPIGKHIEKVAYDGVTSDETASQFSGIYDGDGHVVKNLTITACPLDYAGLFGRTKDATIKNLGVESGTIAATKYYNGGIVGSSEGSKLVNCYSKAALNGAKGGLVGFLGDNGGVYNSYFAGAMSGSGANYEIASAGRTSGEGKIATVEGVYYRTDVGSAKITAGYPGNIGIAA